MSNKNLDASAGLDNLKSIIEKAADSKFLLLLITFLLYLDIWLLNYGINPYKLTLLNTYEAIKNLSVFTVIIFTLSYSLLMSCFFPVMRKLIGVLRLRIDKETYKTKQTVDGKHYADWSLALILLAFYDFVIGFLSKIPSYKGSIYYLLFELTFTNGFVAGVFRFTIGVMFMVCIALALEVDD